MGVVNLRFSGRIRIVLSGLIDQIPLVSIAKVRPRGAARGGLLGGSLSPAVALDAFAK